MSWTRERIARLQLIRTHGLGPLAFQKLLQEYGSADEALTALPQRVKNAGRAPLNVYSEEQAIWEIESTERFGAEILFACDEHFPKPLKSVSPPPPILTCKGRLELFHRPSVSIVGSRNASGAAIRIAGDLARDLGGYDKVIVSGMARGVDTAAHKGALSTGTIAVLAGGVDNIYPPQNTELYEQISENGLVVSESRFGHDPRARDFPRRNRLITGLSQAVIVVEAALKSGSLISARTALEQGRDVLAVPGSPLDPRTKGSNGLIKSGAALVETAADVLDIIEQSAPRQGDLFLEDEAEYEHDTIQFSPSQQELVSNTLSPTPTSIVDIARSCGLPPHICAAILAELELSGAAISLPGGLVHSAL